MLIGIAGVRLTNLDEDKKRTSLYPTLCIAGHLCFKCSSKISRKVTQNEAFIGRVNVCLTLKKTVIYILVRILRPQNGFQLF